MLEANIFHVNIFSPNQAVVNSSQIIILHIPDIYYKPVGVGVTAIIKGKCYGIHDSFEESINQGIYSLSGQMSYHEFSQSLKDW